MEAESARRRKRVDAPPTSTGRKERKVGEEEERLRKQLTENLGKLIPRDRLGAVREFLHSVPCLKILHSVPCPKFYIVGFFTFELLVYCIYNT
jgi:hypothetical protein